MRRLITPAAMRTGEANYFASSGVPSIEVMERAARALADTISAELPAGAAIFFACGAGGNGGDGTACARLLHERYRCTILQPRPPRSPDAMENLRRARECGVSVMDDPALFDPVSDPLSLFQRQKCPSSRLPQPDAWVDALFGTGLSHPPEGAEAALIDRINADRGRGARVYAADIPSGLNGGTGEAYSACVRADRTVTFQYLKAGMTLASGLDRCGKVAVADVGFPAEPFGAPEAALLEPIDLGLPERPRNIHKGDCGHLLIVAGSFGMAGAAALCARAALRSGAGLVTVACVRSIVPILQTLAPQAMCVPLAEEDGAISEEALPALEAALMGKRAAAIGPGLSGHASPAALRLVLESGLPTVIDADGLNLLAKNRALMDLLSARHVLTPHPGEAARLLGRPCVNPLADARALAGLGAVAVLKGAASVIASPASPLPLVSASGGCGMARGGSGDILTGILGALLAAQPNDPCRMAACASELHGLAGELAQQKHGTYAMNAADILEFLPEVFQRYVG